MQTKSLARSAAALLTAGLLLAGCNGITDPAALTPPDEPVILEHPVASTGSATATPGGRTGP